MSYNMHTELFAYDMATTLLSKELFRYALYTHVQSDYIF